MKSGRGKLVFAAVVLVAAAVLIAWNLGAFKSAPKPAPQPEAPDVQTRDPDAAPPAGNRRALPER